MPQLRAACTTRLLLLLDNAQGGVHVGCSQSCSDQTLGVRRCCWGACPRTRRHMTGRAACCRSVTDATELCGSATALHANVVGHYGCIAGCITCSAHAGCFVSLAGENRKRDIGVQGMGYHWALSNPTAPISTVGLATSGHSAATACTLASIE